MFSCLGESPHPILLYSPYSLVLGKADSTSSWGPPLEGQKIFQNEAFYKKSLVRKKTRLFLPFSCWDPSAFLNIPFTKSFPLKNTTAITEFLGDNRFFYWEGSCLVVWVKVHIQIFFLKARILLFWERLIRRLRGVPPWKVKKSFKMKPFT